MNQRGILKDFRDEWVLIYLEDRYKFKYFNQVYLLEKGINKKGSNTIKKNHKEYYTEDKSFN